MVLTHYENKFATYIEQLIQSDPQAERVFIVNGLNTHQSENLVRLDALHYRLDDALRKKGKSVC
jgi:hypothetical protein